jgi:hypothetical protein
MNKQELIKKLDSAFPVTGKYTNEMWLDDVAEQSYGKPFNDLLKQQQEYLALYVEWSCVNPDADGDYDDFYGWMERNGYPTNDFIE